jgi:hypothetical protein
MYIDREAWDFNDFEDELDYGDMDDVPVKETFTARKIQSIRK